MKAHIKHLGEFQKDFSRLFNELCYSRGRLQVWCDVITLAACEISNIVDKVHRQSRTESLSRIMSQYSEKDREIFPRIFANIVDAMTDNPDQDYLGELYMSLELGNSNAGQFFTPYEVCRAMAKIEAGNISEQIKEKGYITVNDCAAGAGALLIAFANECLAQMVNYQNHVLFVGQDIDYTVAMMAYIQLSLLGCAGYVIVGDSLKRPTTGNALYAPMEQEVFVTPMYCSDVWHWRRIWHSFDSLEKTKKEDK